MEIQKNQQAYEKTYQELRSILDQFHHAQAEFKIDAIHKYKLHDLDLLYQKIAAKNSTFTR